MLRSAGMQSSVRLIKSLAIAWALVVSALGLRAWQVSAAKRTAKEYFKNYRGGGRHSIESRTLEIRTLNFLRGDFMVTDWVASPARHWTVNIRSGVVIDWERGAGVQVKRRAHHAKDKAEPIYYHK